MEKSVFELPVEKETEGKKAQDEGDQKRGESESLEEETGNIGSHDSHPIVNVFDLRRGVREERGIDRVVGNQGQEEENSHSDEEDPQHLVLQFFLDGRLCHGSPRLIPQKSA